MCDRHIDQFVEEVLWCGFAYQVPHMLEGGRCPRVENQTGDANCTGRIEKPYNAESATHNRHDQPEDVDSNIVPMVNLENLVSTKDILAKPKDPP